MKKVIVHIVLTFICVTGIVNISTAQPKLVLNGAVVTIANACNLIITNDSSNAIIRNDGYIVSEGEENLLMWHIKETVGTYTVPFGTSNQEYIPITFATSNAVGDGFFNLSTYPTDWENSTLLPQSVTEILTPGNDDSEIIVDRFWQVDAKDYAQKPLIENLEFNYNNASIQDTNNNIVETNLKAIRWNSKLNTWNDFLTINTVDTLENKLVVEEIDETNMFKWWTLVSKSNSSFLPITLLNFKADCENEKTKITWETASEKNNQYFTIENSLDGVNWNTITQIQGKNNSTTVNNYSYLHEATTNNINYYRLKQTDNSNQFSYSEIIKNQCALNAKNSLLVFPNPSSGTINFNMNLIGKDVAIYDVKGELVLLQRFNESNTQLQLNNITDGVYVLKFDGFTEKLIIKK